MKAHIPIYLSSDDNYAPLVAITIASICYNTSEFIDFYVLDGGISLLHKKMIDSLKKNFLNFSVYFLAVDTHRHFGHLPLLDGLTLSMYNRFLIPKLIKNINKAIYSDVDVICIGNIAEMYETDLECYPVGAVYHAYFMKNPKIVDAINSRLELSIGHKYFYSGNLLIDCKMWRELYIYEKLLKIASEYKSRLLFGDQCVINKCFEENNYKRLDYKFCLTTQDCCYFAKYDKEEHLRLQKDVVIRHFESRRKPWLTNMYSKGQPIDNFDDFWFFAAMTPFYVGLQQQFMASLNQPIPEFINNIKKPDQKLLSSLRTKISIKKDKN